MHAPYAAGSVTSQEAAESIEPSSEALCRRILAEVSARGLSGMTCDEIEAALSLAHQTASARVWELCGAGCLTDAGAKRVTRRGRRASVMIATGKAFDPSAVPSRSARESYVIEDARGALAVVRLPAGTAVAEARSLCSTHGLRLVAARTFDASNEGALLAVVRKITKG
jgi:hypothetical protein